MTQLFVLLYNIATAFVCIFMDGFTKTDDELCEIALETCRQIQTAVTTYRESLPSPTLVPVLVSSVKDADTLRDEEMQATHLSFHNRGIPFWDRLQETIFTCVDQILELMPFVVPESLFPDGEYERIKRIINSMTFPSEFKRSFNSDDCTPTKPLFTFRMTVDDYLLNEFDIRREEAIEFFNMLEKYKPDHPRCNSTSTNGFDMKIKGKWTRFNSKDFGTLMNHGLYSWFGGWDGEYLTVEMHPNDYKDKDFGPIMWVMQAASYGLSVSDYKISQHMSPDDRLVKYPARPHVVDRFEVLKSYIESYLDPVESL